MNVGATPIAALHFRKGDRLPADVDRERLAQFVLAVMEGGVMLSRSHRDVKPFDQAVAELRAYFKRLLDAPQKDRKKKGGRGA